MSDQDRAFLIVQIDKRLFAIESSYIRELVSVPPLFPLPLSLDDILYLAVLRGEPHAILNSMYFLDVPNKERDKVVFLIGNMGILIDDAVQTIRHNFPNTSPQAPADNPSWFYPYTINFRGNEIPVLNVPKVLTHVPDENR